MTREKPEPRRDGAGSLRFDAVTAGWTKTATIKDISLELPRGTFTALVGPNGSGKSTLLKTIYRVLRPTAGTILLDADDLWTLPPRRMAQSVGVLGQTDQGGADFTVIELVSLGRSPHRALLQTTSASDREVVARALEQVEASELASRPVGTLSGGERQRVMMARALAQEPEILVLDEPTNHLDPYHQFALLELISGLGLTVLAALHSLDLAARYADQIGVVHDGRLLCVGPPGQALSPGLLRTVFGVDGTVGIDSADGRPTLQLRPLVRG